MENQDLLSILAVILAALAFVASVLQVLSDYMSSSTERNICNASVIGAASKRTTYGFNLKAWKIRVFYPLLHMDPGRILTLYMKTQLHTIQQNDSMEVIREHHDGTWRTRESDEKISSDIVADESAVLVKLKRDARRKVPVSIKDLSWSDSLRFRWYRFLHPLRPVERPRASWAQMLAIFGLKDLSSMTIHLVNAESIPSTMDTPVQRIKLRKLAKLAFVLGFQSVELSIPRRHFRATSPIGSITIQQTDAVGSFLRFEGDLFAFRTLISRCSAKWVWRGADMTEGRPSFGKYLGSQNFHPLRTLARAIVNNLPSGTYDDEERRDVIASGLGYSTGAVHLESEIMRRFVLQLVRQDKFKWRNELTKAPTTFTTSPSSQSQARAAYIDDSTKFREILMSNVAENTELFEGCAARWQVKTGNTMPTIFVAATFVSIHGIVCGYPVRTLLLPFVPWVRRRARHFFNAMPRPYYTSTAFSTALRKGDLLFTRETSDYVMSSGLGCSQFGLFGWGISNLADVYRTLPSTVKAQLVPNEDEWVVQALLTPDTERLLRDFELDRWAAAISAAKQTTFVGFNPINCLWTQIIMLDMAIQYFIRGHWGFEPMKDPLEETSISDALRLQRKGLEDEFSEKIRVYHPFFTESWGRKEAAVIPGIVNAWRMPNLRESQDELLIDSLGAPEDFETDLTVGVDVAGIELRDWDLSRALYEEPGIRFGEDSASTVHGNRQQMCSRLADLLELRAIFVFAFLMLHPDSSDLYDSALKEEDIEMPIA